MSAQPQRCPKCEKTDIQSNHVHTHAAAHNTVHHLGAHGNPVILGIAGAAWLVGEAINLSSHEWVCGNCGHTFSSPEPPAEEKPSGEQPPSKTSDDFDLFDF